MSVDHECTEHFRDFMLAMLNEEIALDKIDPEVLKNTPNRVIRAYHEFVSGYKQDPAAPLKKQFQVDHANQLVVIKNIDYYSMCEHHLLPFYGKCSVGYLPVGDIVFGASKIPRVVEIYARRLQLQERLVNQIADTIFDTGLVSFVIVYADGVHFCMRMRGIKSPCASMTNSAVRRFTAKVDDASKNSMIHEFYEMISR
jgi:GTP cyclohydrolase I